MYLSVHLPSVLLTLMSLSATHATHLRIALPANSPSLPPTTHASLTTLGTVLSAPLRVDNTFDFRNVTAGSYLLDVHSHSHAFAPLRVDVHPSSEAVPESVEAYQTFRGNEWANKGEVLRVVQDGGIWKFDIRAGKEKEYFYERTGFSPLSILKSPMILIAIATMGIVFGMPYLMDNMDPELRAEFEETQKKSPLSGGQSANALQNFDAAAWLAGSGGAKKGDAPAQGVTR